MTEAIPETLRSAARELKAKEGLAISEEGLTKLAKVGGLKTSKDVWNYLSTADLKLFGDKNFPPSMKTTTKINGVRVVQIQNFRDICRPTTKEPAQCGKGRMLWFAVTDGAKNSSYEFLEFDPCPKLDVKNLFPGVKLQVRDLEVKGGICILRPGKIVRIFGDVKALQDSFVVRSKMKARAVFLKSLKDGEKPPPEFKPFNEKKWLLEKKNIKQEVDLSDVNILDINKRDPSKPKANGSKDSFQNVGKEEEIEPNSDQRNGRNQKDRNRKQNPKEYNSIKQWNDRNKNPDNRERNDRNRKQDNRERNDRNKKQDNRERNDRNNKQDNRDRNDRNNRRGKQDVRHNKGDRNQNQGGRGRNENQGGRNQNRNQNRGRNNDRDQHRRNDDRDQYRRNDDCDQYRRNDDRDQYRRNNDRDQYRRNNDRGRQNDRNQYQNQNYPPLQPPMDVPYQPTEQDMTALYQLGITSDLGLLAHALIVCGGNRDQAIAYIYSIGPSGGYPPMAPPDAHYFNPMGH